MTTGMRCPECGEVESFEIVAAVPALVRFFAGGAHEVEDLAVDDERIRWTDASSVECMTCHHKGTVREFRSPVAG